MTSSKALTKNLATEAFNRVSPLIGKHKKASKKLFYLIGNEYKRLPKSERAAFSEKIYKKHGWTRNYVQVLAASAEELPNKLHVIEMVSKTPLKTKDSSGGGFSHLITIAGIEEKSLKEAAEKGMFDKPVSVADLRYLKRTGCIPQKKLPTKAQTDLQKIRGHMEQTTTHIDKAINHMSDILHIMETSNITDAKGKEATKLIQSFEKLCTKMAAANPATSKRAFQILRGEA